MLPTHEAVVAGAPLQGIAAPITVNTVVAAAAIDAVVRHRRETAGWGAADRPRHVSWGDGFIRIRADECGHGGYPLSSVQRPRLLKASLCASIADKNSYQDSALWTHKIS
jgi:hypothetical protein